MLCRPLPRPVAPGTGKPVAAEAPEPAGLVHQAASAAHHSPVSNERSVAHRPAMCQSSAQVQGSWMGHLKTWSIVSLVALLSAALVGAPLLMKLRKVTEQYDLIAGNVAGPDFTEGSDEHLARNPG